MVRESEATTHRRRRRRHLQRGDAGAGGLRARHRHSGRRDAGRQGIAALRPPASLGALGATGTTAANEVARDADLVIGIGTRWSDFTTASYSVFQNPDVEIVNINVTPFDTTKLSGAAIVADARDGPRRTRRCSSTDGACTRHSNASTKPVARVERDRRGRLPPRATHRCRPRAR